LHIFWKKVRENLSRLFFNEFKLATSKTLGYDIPKLVAEYAVAVLGKNI